MKAVKLPLFKSYNDKSDCDAVTNIIKRGMFWAEGPEISEFENIIAKYIKAKYVLAFNSGTSALFTLLLANDIRGREVIVPSFTFIATVNAVLLAGGIPVFAETEPDTFGLDYKDVAKKITSNTRAIIQLHYGGMPSRDIIKLKGLAKKKKLLLLEDAAQSFGAKLNGRFVGTFGDGAIFSFCQNKVITTGEGGVLITDSKKVYETAKLIRSHGRSNDDYFTSTIESSYLFPGYNFRIPTISAALGISQFKKIKKLTAERKSRALYLNKHLSKIRYISLPTPTIDSSQVYQMYTIKLQDKEIRDALKDHLAREGIMSKIYFNPLHLMGLFSQYKCNLPATEKLSDRVLTLPFYATMTRKDMDLIIKTIYNFLGGKK